jgi:hypothetical protein
MTAESEKSQSRTKMKRSKHKGYPMRLKTHVSQEGTKNMGTPVTRAMYINTRTCLQTFRGYFTRFLNIPVRLMEGHVSVSHCVVMLSTELPPEGYKSGQKYKLKKPWKMTSSTYELDIPRLGEKQASINMGSAQEMLPTTTRHHKNLIYLGTTTMSDEEILGMGELILD